MALSRAALKINRFQHTFSSKMFVAYAAALSKQICKFSTLELHVNAGSNNLFKMSKDPAVKRFIEYLQIKSVHPEPDYDGCIAWVKRQSEEIGLKFHQLKLGEVGETVCWATWSGSDTSLPSIMLNSHMDVVPVDQSKWKYDAFSAYKDSDGNIYARGTQDMKSVGAQYLEAIRRLKPTGFQPRRTIHVTFVPDEEMGGSRGMQLFVKTPEFKALNVGLEMDEAGACSTEEFFFFNAEKTIWQVEINAKGNTGHALHFTPNTAAEKSRKIINTFLDFRGEEQKRLKPDRIEDLGNVTTVNLTLIQGGVQPNVIPSEITMTFDFRITPKWSQKDAEEFIDKTCREAGDDVTYKFINKAPFIPEILLTADNIWWTTFKSTMEKMGLKLIPMVCPGATDARHVRELGITAFGFSPINNTPVLLHDNNEFVNEKVFLKGIEIYEELIKKLSNVA